MDLKLPDQVNAVISTLEKSGYEAYAVGGCVRDMLMGKSPKDFDITTNAVPNEVKSVFADLTVIETGIKHGTVTVLIGGAPIEITTYRIDGEYKDGRHPKQVCFTKSLKDDLARRDFTVNAIAYNENTGLFDPFSGCVDIEKSVIRCVGNADIRFKEDALRIMRAVRFMSELGFDVEKQTAESVIKNRRLLDSISKERIYAELKRLLLGDGAEKALTEFWQVIEVVLPVTFPKDEENAAPKRVALMPKELNIRLAALLYSVPDKAKWALSSLKAEKRTIKAVMGVLQFKDEKAPKDKAEVKQFLRRIGADSFIGLCVLLSAEKGKEWQKAQTMCEQVIKSGECYSLKTLAVSGDDLIAAGIKAGEDVGNALDSLLNKVINNEVKNNKDELLKMLKNFQNGVDKIDD